MSAVILVVLSFISPNLLFPSRMKLAIIFPSIYSRIACIAYYEYFHHSFAIIFISLASIITIVLIAASSITKNFVLKHHFVFFISFDWN
jgi:hypothetical protein